MSAAPLRVAELFGPTFQGEGPSCGQRAAFVRLSGCAVGCAWCDEPQTWDWSRFDRQAETRLLSVGEVSDWAGAIPAELVVITGGEPLAQQRGLVPLAAALTRAGRRVEIETSGTITPSRSLLGTGAAFNVSPKLASSGVPAARRIRPGPLSAFAACDRAVFKFVACSTDDLAEVAGLEARFALAPIWIMPEGVTADKVLAGLRLLADGVLARGWHLTSRMHVLMWGDARGR